MIELIFVVYLFVSVFCFLYILYKLFYKKQWRFLFSVKVLIYVSAWIVFSYSRFIEPYWILQKDTDIKIGWEAKVVVISDIHLGEVKKADYLEKIVEKINAIPQVDFVVIAGDFTFLRKKKSSLDDLFSPL